MPSAGAEAERKNSHITNLWLDRIDREREHPMEGARVTGSVITRPSGR
jgi:hypothetical protein